MFAEALEFCKRIGLNEVIVTFDKFNTASYKVIKNNGGILDAEFYSNVFKEIIQQFIVK